uniref:Uncharacterized protein n=1 Tax=Tanacetum cinerariifolium TaxID=118510 RepID=A0A6L2JNM1_TANCI|nr:hypothetical protein [Tanacetum cinerariifolium]
MKCWMVLVVPRHRRGREEVIKVLVRCLVGYLVMSWRCLRSKPSGNDGKKVDEDPRNESECKDQEKEDNVNSTNNVDTVSLTVNTAGINRVNVVSENISIKLSFDPNMPALKDVSIFNFSRDNVNDGALADMNNLDTTIQVIPIPTTRIHKNHPLNQVFRDLQSATQIRKMSKNSEEHGFVSTI